MPFSTTGSIFILYYFLDIYNSPNIPPAISKNKSEIESRYICGLWDINIDINCSYNSHPKPITKTDNIKIPIGKFDLEEILL